MKTIAVVAGKGGCGKTLIASSLAVRASHESGKVAILDANEGQSTISEWWVQRGRPISPYLYNAKGTLDELIATLNEADWDWCVIDGAPSDQDLMEMCIIVADLVVVPVKLAYFDTSAVDVLVAMCQRHKKPYAFVVNEFDPRKTYATANQIGLTSLKGRGKIFDARISVDPKHRVGQLQGKTGAELSTQLAKEIDGLWKETKALAGVPALRAVRGGQNA